MGISAKPIGKNKSNLVKLENEMAKGGKKKPSKGKKDKDDE